MATLKNYKALTKQFLKHYEEVWSDVVEPELDMIHIFDDETKQYILLETGWQKSTHIRRIILHIAMKNNKIWIEEDMTEEGIATYFLAQGVPPDDIVLGFHPPQMRPYTEFATT
ncbi:MAG: XisI protein [Planctomycetes bacterium]|nr:XisI protein [Planctomycetota bacterium]